MHLTSKLWTCYRPDTQQVSKSCFSRVSLLHLHHGHWGSRLTDRRIGRSVGTFLAQLCNLPKAQRSHCWGTQSKRKEHEQTIFVYICDSWLNLFCQVRDYSSFFILWIWLQFLLNTCRWVVTAMVDFVLPQARGLPRNRSFRILKYDFLPSSSVKLPGEQLHWRLGTTATRRVGNPTGNRWFCVVLNVESLICRNQVDWLLIHIRCICIQQNCFYILSLYIIFFQETPPWNPPYESRLSIWRSSPSLALAVSVISQLLGNATRQLLLKRHNSFWRVSFYTFVFSF